MTARELAAYHAGLRQAAEWALIAALTLEMRDDSVRQTYRVAIEALRGLAEGLHAESSPEGAVQAMMAQIARDPTTSGEGARPRNQGNEA